MDNSTTPNIKFVEETLPAKLSMDHVVSILSRIFSSFDVNLEDLNLQKFTVGTTNHLYAVYKGDDLNHAAADLPDKTSADFKSVEAALPLLIRVYGENTELVIDRNMEVQAMQLLYFNQCGPRVWARFSNGLVYEYLKGQASHVDMIRSELGIKLISKEMARIHAIAVGRFSPWFPAMKEPCLFRNLHSWLARLPNEQEDEIYQNGFPSKKVLNKEICCLEARLAPLTSDIVFCHNDAMGRNFIFTPDNERVYMIDFEYADYNYAAFDIGNHFAEFAGNDPVDYSYYPDRETQLHWLENYLHCRRKFLAASPSDNGPCQELPSAQELYVHVNQFTLASHLYWSIWAALQAKYSDVKFDFLKYALIRWKEYCRTKDTMLTLSVDHNVDGTVGN